MNLEKTVNHGDTANMPQSKFRGTAKSLPFWVLLAHSVGDLSI
ncbi:MAG: hypothetical protein WAZ34_03665 [Rhodocyclaceae bacterium]